MTPTTLAETILRELPRLVFTNYGQPERFIKEADVLAALTAALDGVDERAVEVAAECKRQGDKAHETVGATHFMRALWSAETTITALLAQNAALRARVETMIDADTVQKMLDDAQPIMAEACRGYEEANRDLEARLTAADAHIAALTARVEGLTGALGHIESMAVHSGGEIHGVTAQHWKSAFEEAQEVARAALTQKEPTNG